MAVVIIDTENGTIDWCISEAVRLIGDFAVPPGKEIIVKPNLLSATWDKIYTSPPVLNAVCAYLASKCKNKIVIVETDTLVGNADDVFRELGIDKMARLMDIELLNAVRDRKTLIKCREGFLNEFYLSKRVMDGVRVNVAIMKPYNSISRYLKHLGMSCALKNFFGLIAERNKYKYHGYSDLNLPKIILDVNRTIPPAIIFVEHGKKLLCSKNPVEADAVASRLSGLDPLKIEYLNMAKKIGLGENDPEKIEIITSDRRSS
jgi:uncharacterized protein (DUF362 family)